MASSAAPVILAPTGPVEVGHAATFTVQDKPTLLCYTDAATGAELCGADIQLVFDPTVFDAASLQVTYESPFDLYSFETNGVVTLLAFQSDFNAGTSVQLTAVDQTLFTFMLTALVSTGNGSPTSVGLQAPEMGSYGGVSGTPADPIAGTPAQPAFPTAPPVSLDVVQAAAVPEPSSALLALAGLGGMAALRRRRHAAT